MFNIFWLIISYILGSVPFGYIITRLSTGKNILEIGWRKTSGSNVFKNVGKWQGALTGILDVLKGYLAVFLAQELGFSNNIQILAGIAAVCGHNWSIFLGFAGGRGIGTLIGAFSAFSLKILALALIPFILVGIIWNFSIGTLLFFPTAAIISLFFNQFDPVGIFVLITLLPVLIKRLSPLREIFPIAQKKKLIRNRLLFDNDKAFFELRIKKILKSCG
jgi:glycerol-3-phosphate acyltransferase PlsY